jgi:hypothetical protein
MSILLLTQGDQRAKDLLKRAIMARYHTSPLALEALRIDYRGRGNIKIGPVQSWIPLEARLYFRFPDAMRWDYSVRPLGLPLQRGTGSYFNEHFYSQHHPKPITSNTILEHLRLCIWAMGAVMLTPLSDMSIRVETLSSLSFTVINSVTRDRFEVMLDRDYMVQAIRFSSFNVEEERRQVITVRPSVEMLLLDGLPIPSHVEVFRNDNLLYKADVVNVVSNPQLDTNDFLPGYASV